ncbi:MAG TPA: C40 family peptidase [bacterium]|nr:C40 family peptidase [bacterium]
MNSPEPSVYASDSGLILLDFNSSFIYFALRKKGVQVFTREVNQQKFINVGVASIYAEPTFLSPIVTQAILGEQLSVLNMKDDWLYIRQWDEYEGWLYRFSVVDPPDEWEPNIRYGEPHGWVYQHPSATSGPVRQICIGVELPGEMTDEQWMKVILPDGMTGYVKTRELSQNGESDRQQVLASAERFLGASYLWGGKTALGFDCSGYVQTVFWLHGIRLRRDAWQQAAQTRVLSGRPELQPGDLVFFTKNDQVDHVGIAYDPDRFIHCSGWVRVNSFDENAPDYDQRLDRIFSGANRVIQD